MVLRIRFYPVYYQNLTNTKDTVLQISICHKPGLYILLPLKVFAWAPDLNNSCWPTCPD